MEAHVNINRLKSDQPNLHHIGEDEVNKNPVSSMGSISKKTLGKIGEIPFKQDTPISKKAEILTKPESGDAKSKELIFKNPGGDVKKVKNVRFEHTEFTEAPEQPPIIISNPEYPEIAENDDKAIAEFIPQKNLKGKSDMESGGFYIALDYSPPNEGATPSSIKWFIEKDGQKLDVNNYLKYALKSSGSDTFNKELYNEVLNYTTHYNDVLSKVDTNIQATLFTCPPEDTDDESLGIPNLYSKLGDKCDQALTSLGHLYNLNARAGFNNSPDQRRGKEEYNIVNPLKNSIVTPIQQNIVYVLDQIDIQNRPFIVDIMSNLIESKIVANDFQILDSAIFNPGKGDFDGEALQHISNFLEGYVSYIKNLPLLDEDIEPYRIVLNDYRDSFLAMAKHINDYKSLKEEFNLGLITEEYFKEKLTTLLDKFDATRTALGDVWIAYGEVCEKIIQHENNEFEPPHFLISLTHKLSEIDEAIENDARLTMRDDDVDELSSEGSKESLESEQPFVDILLDRLDTMVQTSVDLKNQNDNYLEDADLGQELRNGLEECNREFIEIDKKIKEVLSREDFEDVNENDELEDGVLTIFVKQEAAFESLKKKNEILLDECFKELDY